MIFTDRDRLLAKRAGVLFLDPRSDALLMEDVFYVARHLTNNGRSGEFLLANGTFDARRGSLLKIDLVSVLSSSCRVCLKGSWDKVGLRISGPSQIKNRIYLLISKSSSLRVRRLVGWRGSRSCRIFWLGRTCFLWRWWVNEWSLVDSRRPTSQVKDALPVNIAARG